jgi:hypothetical protein
MATHGHVQGEQPGTAGDKASQNMSGVENAGRLHITQLNHAEKAIVSHALTSWSPTASDLKAASDVLGTASHGLEDDEAGQAYARQHAAISMRAAGTLHLVRHADCGSRLLHDGKTMNFECQGCGGTIASPADIDGVSAGHPFAPLSREI